MKKSFTSGLYIIVFIVVANILFISSHVPLFILMNRTPPNTVFPLISSLEAPHDYYLYLSAITQGKYGAWLFHDPYTSESTSPGIFYLYYILAGKIAAVFNLSSIVTYHLIKIITVELLFILIYLLINILLDKKAAFWASIFSIFGTVSPFFLFNEKDAFVTYTPWWHISDALKRMGALPHYTFGQCLFILFCILLILFLRKQTWRYLFLSCLTIFISGIFLPYTLLPAIAGLSTIIILRLIKYYPRLPLKLLKDKISCGLILIVIISSISAIISFWQTKQGFPWNSAWSVWDKNFWNVQKGIEYSVILSFGILPLLSLPSIIHIFKSGKEEMVFIIIWAISPIIFLPFVSMFDIAKIRLVAVNPFIPFGILAAYFLFQILKKWQSQLLFILIFFLSAVPVTLKILWFDMQKSKNISIYSNLFLPKPVFEAISFIEKNFENNTAVISNEYLGVIIPAFAPVKSFYAHYTFTMNFSDKAMNVRLLYGKKLNENEALKFLSENNIRYIYFGQDESDFGHGRLEYNFLTPMFDKEDVVLYKVR